MKHLEQQKRQETIFPNCLSLASSPSDTETNYGRRWRHWRDFCPWIAPLSAANWTARQSSGWSLPSSGHRATLKASVSYWSCSSEPLSLSLSLSHSVHVKTLQSRYKINVQAKCFWLETWKSMKCLHSADVQFHSSVFITALIALSIVIDNTSQCTYKETKEKGVQHWHPQRMQCNYSKWKYISVIFMCRQ